MSKKPRKAKKKKSPTVKATSKSKSFKPGRRTFISLGAIGLLGVSGYFGVSAYIDNQAVLHDLSTIGKGRPVLVQIHDPQCPMCRTLLSSVESVLDEFPEVEFRIANIKTGSGSVFAGRHSVSNVTLLMFDARGKRLATGIGFQSTDEVRKFLRNNLKG